MNFTYGPLNFWKKFTTHNFPKKYLKLWYNPPINPNLKKKAFNFPQINKTPKQNQTTSNFTTTAPYSKLPERRWCQINEGHWPSAARSRSLFLVIILIDYVAIVEPKRVSRPFHFHSWKHYDSIPYATFLWTKPHSRTPCTKLILAYVFEVNLVRGWDSRPKRTCACILSMSNVVSLN
jgi:hypothetical protein